MYICCFLHFMRLMRGRTLLQTCLWGCPLHLLEQWPEMSQSSWRVSSPPLCGMQPMAPLPQHMGPSQQRAGEHGREMGVQVPFSVEIVSYISPWHPDIIASIATVFRWPSWESVSSTVSVIRSFLVSPTTLLSPGVL